MYSQFIQGIKNRDQKLITQICEKCPKLVDVHCIFDIELESKFKSSFVIPNAPDFTSLQSAAELLEVYAMSLMRNFNFTLFDSKSFQYDSMPSNAKSYINYILGTLNVNWIQNNLNAPPLRGNRTITTDTLYRGNTQGDLIGPYISQFLYYETAIGNFKLEQKYQCLDIDENINIIDISNTPFYFGQTEAYFREIWNGTLKSSSLPTIPKYITCLLDMAMYINRDQIWEAIFIAVTLLLTRNVAIGFHTSSRSTSGKFINLGVNDLYYLMMKATKLAMNSAWVWKWSQLRPRPEEMAYQVHLTKTYTATQMNGSSVQFPQDLLNHPILTEISNDNHGRFLMPLGYSQGSPFHPAYPAGHAVIAGAMATIAKAWFNCDWEIPAVVPNINGDNLILYKTKDNSLEDSNGVVYLKIGDELDKLATNCSNSRCMAGIHYRSDADAGLLLGEQVAIEVLKDEVQKYSDNIAFVLRKRNGEEVTIANHKNKLEPKPYPSTYNSNGRKAIYSTTVGKIALPNGNAPNPTQNNASIFSNSSELFNQTLF